MYLTPSFQVRPYTSKVFFVTPSFIYFLFLMEVQLTHNITLVSGVQRSDRTSVHITLCSPREAPVGHGTAPWQHHALYSPCRVFNYFLIYLVRNLAVVFSYYTSILDIYPSPLLRDFSVALSLRRRISRSKRKHIQTLIDSDKLPKRLFWCLNSINRRSRLNHTHFCLGKIFILSHTLSNFFLFCFLGFFSFFF